MGELNEGRWAVMSERGREAQGLTYAEALELERKLKGQRVSGLCVITDAAGLRLPPAKKAGKRRAGRKGKSAT